MIHLASVRDLLTGLTHTLTPRRRRCPLCGARCDDLAAHQAVFHIPAELDAWEAMRR